MTIIRSIIFTLIALFINLNSVYAGDDHSYSDERIYARAEIIKIETQTVERGQGIRLQETVVHLEILDGPLKDEKKKAYFGGESDLPKEIQYQVGDKVFIGISDSHDSTSYGAISLYDIDNSPGIIVLVVLFLVAVALLGRIKGIASLIALAITIFLLFLVLIPLTLKGYPPLPISIAIACFSVLITLPIIAGFKKKTLAAILGAAGGILVATSLALIFGNFLHLSGIVTNEMLTIFYVADVNIDLKGLVLSGMIIAALGAVMDVCISIASSAAEIYSANPEISDKEAFKSVLTIGTDILGSMVNTLILAYVGSSLSMILWIAMKLKPGMSFWMVLNHNPVLNELLKSIVGSLGMFVCIPLTAMVAVRLYSPHRK